MALLGFVNSSCCTYDTKGHDELIGVPIEVAFTQINAKASHDEVITVSEARELYTAVPRGFPLKDTNDDMSLIRVISWNLGDRFIRFLCLKNREKWIIFDAIDVPSDKIF